MRWSTSAATSASLVEKWYIRPGLLSPAARAADSRERLPPSRRRSRAASSAATRWEGRWAGFTRLTLPTGWWVNQGGASPGSVWSAEETLDESPRGVMCFTNVLDSSLAGGAMEQHPYLVGLVGAGVGPSLTPALHMREAAAHRLPYVYRTIDITTLGLAPT